MFNIEIFDNTLITPAWVADGQIPRPINEIEFPTISNSQIISLYNGDQAMYIPSVKTRKGQLSYDISPFGMDASMRAKIQGYIDNNTGIKITLHTGEKIEGFIMNLVKKYASTGANQVYFSRISIQLFDVDGSGGIGD